MLTKMLNGVRTVCSSEEEDAISSEWAAGAEKEPPLPRRIVDEIIRDPDQLAALKAALTK